MLQISDAEIANKLEADNPWWKGDIASVKALAGLPLRAYLPRFLDLVTERSVRRAVILMGPRRVGKTIMLHQCIQELLRRGVPQRNILYASLDTPTYNGLPLERMLQLFLTHNRIDSGSEAVVFFDEIQYLRDWEVHLKVLVDSYPRIWFAASGSAAAALKLKSQESGAGRFTEFLLPPLTFAEYLRFVGREDELIERVETHDWPPQDYRTGDIAGLNREFVKYVNFGGFPEAVYSQAVQENPARYIKSDIVDKVLLRDLPSLYGIQNIQELNQLFTAIAYNTGNQFSLESLASSSGISKNTLSRYLEYLEAAFLIVRVRRVDERGAHFHRERAFKVYLTNPSMRAALFHMARADDDVMGNLAETALFSQWFHSPARERLRYASWRGAEVDIVFLDPQQRPIWALEVKWSDNYAQNPRQHRGLIEFGRKNGLSTVFATTRTQRSTHKVDGLTVEQYPCSLHCYRVGRHAIEFGRDPSAGRALP